ncbi:MAG TPA: DNA cytosine methyltransferase, partial [Longimicrobium sp.]
MYEDTDDQFDFLADPHAAVEAFADEPLRGTIRRDIVLRNGATASSKVCRGKVREADLASAFDLAWLRTRVRPPTNDARGTLRLVDLFSGCGSMSLGVWEACRALNVRPVPLLAVDINMRALGIYGRNFPNAVLSDTPVEVILDGRIGDPASSAEAAFRHELGPVDLLLGGPPCQGHSDLNNHTRRDDPKNRLYLRMARFAEVVRPRAILIENVPGALHDRSGVVQETLRVLRLLGYSVSTGIVHTERLGVPQRRRRFFTIASLAHEIDFAASIAPYHRTPRSVSWAISDLLDRVETG